MAAKKSKRDIERRRSTAAQRRIDAFHRRDAERRGAMSIPSFENLQTKEWILDWNCVFFKRGSLVIYSRSDMSI